jgi:hypothetical protein
MTVLKRYTNTRWFLHASIISLLNWTVNFKKEHEMCKMSTDSVYKQTRQYWNAALSVHCITLLTWHFDCWYARKFFIWLLEISHATDKKNCGDLKVRIFCTRNQDQHTTWCRRVTYIGNFRPSSASRSPSVSKFNIRGLVLNGSSDSDQPPELANGEDTFSLLASHCTHCITLLLYRIHLKATISTIYLRESPYQV